MKVIINTHDSYFDCETCGGSGSTVVSFSGDLGEFQDGSEATCFGGRDGNILTVLEELNKRLKETGITVELKQLPENYVEIEQAHMNNMDAVDWDSDKLSSEQNELYEEYCKLYDDYEDFYDQDNLVQFYAQYGVEVTFEMSQDDVYRWDDDDEDYDLYIDDEDE